MPNRRRTVKSSKNTEIEFFVELQDLREEVSRLCSIDLSMEATGEPSKLQVTRDPSPPASSRLPDQSSGSCMVASSLIGPIVLINNRALQRDCLSRVLAIEFPHRAVLTFASIDDWNAVADQEASTPLIFLCEGDSVVDLAALGLGSATRQPTPVILLSDAEDPASIFRALDMGVKGYIPSKSRDRSRDRGNAPRYGWRRIRAGGQPDTRCQRTRDNAPRTRRKTARADLAASVVDHSGGQPREIQRRHSQRAQSSREHGQSAYSQHHEEAQGEEPDGHRSQIARYPPCPGPRDLQCPRDHSAARTKYKGLLTRKQRYSPMAAPPARAAAPIAPWRALPHRRLVAYGLWRRQMPAHASSVWHGQGNRLVAVAICSAAVNEMKPPKGEKRSWRAPESPGSAPAS
ncbi:hypothetical protein LMIY3S_01491 [Labrys miyagiensis]